MNFCIKAYWVFAWDCFESIDQFEENHHLDSVDTSSPRRLSASPVLSIARPLTMTVQLFSQVSGQSGVQPALKPSLGPPAVHVHFPCFH